MRKAFKRTLIILSIPLVLFAGLLVFSTLTDYRPEPEIEEPLSLEGKGIKIVGDTLTALIWNIGYAGLGAEMDFFNDGGKMVRPSEEQNNRFLEGIAAFIAKYRDSVDYLLLQEVDKNSKRSYYTNQQERIASVLPDFASCFALNYDVKFVPVPFAFPYTPYGKTYGGLVSYSRFEPQASLRLQYPGGFDWPTRLYMLDRCALEQKFKLPNGKELLIVNTHNTAYDATGEIKKQELEYLKKRYEAESEKGNYVLIGGDWNQVPPGLSSTHFNTKMPEGYTPQAVTAEQFPNGFGVSYDEKIPTNRSNDKPYKAGATYTTLIDYFVHSPNVEVVEVRGIDLQFKHSDHQPVILKFCLKAIN
jgi:endonuclease/exonuclease/phosphatase family metal-dependent hydrolase